MKHEPCYCQLTPAIYARLNELAERWEKSTFEVAQILLERSLNVAENEPMCRGCGCTEFDPCFHADGLPCSWAGEEWCSLCQAKAEGME